MRVADKMAYDQVNRSVSKNRTEMSALQNQAATQKRVTKPSDDPVAASRVLASRMEQRGSEQFIKNLNYAKSFLDFTEQSLTELTDVIVRAKELAISQSNDASANAQSRKITAAEIAQLHDQTIQIANRKLGERFIFAGFKTTTAPFDENGVYHGDEGEIKLHVDKESFLAMNVPGSVVFEGYGLSKDGVSYTSSRQARTVDEWRHQAEARGEDLERAEKEEWQHSKPEFKADKGYSVDRDKQISSIRGPASVSEAKANEPTRGPASALRVSEKVKDTIDRTGLSEGENVFDTLKKLEVALVTNDKGAVQESLDRLDNVLQQVVMMRTSLGSRVNTIENTLNSLNSNLVETKTGISQLEDADAFEVISDINKTEGALQATLQTSGRLIQKSLMDFIS